MLELSFVHWLFILGGAKYIIVGAWLFARYRRNTRESVPITK